MGGAAAGEVTTRLGGGGAVLNERQWVSFTRALIAMLSLGATTQIYLRPGPTDLRLGYEGLSQLAPQRFGQLAR